VLALVVQDRALAVDLRSAAAQRLERSAHAADGLIEAHLRSLADRYRAISGTPQFRANLEIGDAPTLRYYAAELLERETAAAILFVDREGRSMASAGDEALVRDAQRRTDASLLSKPTGLFAVVRTPLRTGDTVVGTLVAAEEIGPAVLAHWSDLCGTDVALGRDTGSNESRVDRVVRRFEGNWTLRVSASLDTERRALANARRNLLLSGGVALVLAFGASFLFARGLVRPILEIQNAAVKIGDGDFGTRIESQRTDELGDVARSVDRMLEHLRGYRRQVEEQHRTLEEKVRERTGELKSARDEAVRLANEADEANRSKSQFLANMSHEIRTPMNGVMGMTDLLLDTSLSPRQRKLAETVGRSAEQLLGIINDILDFSKGEAGKVVLDLADCSIREIVEDVGDLLAPRAHAKGIELAHFVAPDAPPLVRADAGRLRQILTNLVGNAIKFTESGEVAITVGWKDGDDGRSRMRFEVRDTGIGIDPEAHEHVFSAFSQGDATTTRRYGGTGLGLAISKNLVELMGGTIGLDSARDVGSRFWFELPLEVSPESPSVAAAVRVDFAKARVLVVDDNATNREILQHQLLTWQMRATSVPDAGAALESLRSAVAEGDPFELLILDRHMPGIDGAELARRIRADETLAAPHMILLTSMARDARSEPSELDGIEAHLTKPVRQSDLFDAITRVLSGLHVAPNASDAVDPPDARPERGSRGLVLVVEDNEVNQTVAREMLDHLGYRVHVVEDGVRALEVLEAGQYDLVLMDCQMPRMDGFEATREIRRREADRAGDRTPIVALTANAQGSDRQRCLDSGMDDYLAKPFSRESLGAVLDRWIVTPGADSPEAPTGRSADLNEAAAIESEALDAIRALDSDRGEQILRNVLRVFLETLPKQIAALDEAFARDDGAAIRDSAHSLKSSSANVGARRLSQLARSLEEIARSGSTSGTEGTFASLREEASAVEAALSKLTEAA